MKNTVRLQILGKEYTVKSDEGEERVGKIVEYINRKMKEVAGDTKTVSTLNIAILVVLDIANDYFQVMEESNLLSRRIEAESGRLIKMIESKIN